MKLGFVSPARSLLALLALIAGSCVRDGFWTDPPITPVEHFPRFSPDGKRVVFNREFDPPRPDGLYTVDVDGCSDSLICDGGCPAWSPDGSTLAVGRSDLSIWIIDARTGLPVRKVYEVGTPFGGIDWSKNGTWITYNSALYPDVGIARVDVETGDMKLIVPSPARDARWSPDSRSIVYCSNGICVADSTGEGRRTILPNSETFQFRSPCWLGRRILCTYHYAGGSEYAAGQAVVETDGTWRPHSLAGGGNSDYDSIAGRIVRTVWTDEKPHGAGRLFVVRADGTDDHQLTRSP